jgi:protein involved in polysaccharide export with SLBB domain
MGHARALARALGLAIVLLFCSVIGAHAAQAAAAPATEEPAYKLGPGDKLHVTVFNETDLSGDFEVSDQGMVALPLIGQVKVAGKTLSETDELIAQKYGANYLVNPRVSVEVLNYRPFFILGEVKNPGGYPYVAGMTVLNAVALAGGYTPRAVRGEVELQHAHSSTSLTVHEDYTVLPGDVIRVNERFF